MTNQLPAWLQSTLDRIGTNSWLHALVIVLASLVVAKLADWLVTGVLLVWARRSRTDLDDRLLKILHRPVFLSVLLVGLWLALVELGPEPPYQGLISSLVKTAAILLWLSFSLRLCSLLLDAVSRVEGRFEAIRPNTLPLFDKLLKGVVVAGSLYFLFLSWGIDVGAWIVSAGIVGIAVGFAAKDTLANLFSGFFILADAPYKVGDFVVLDSGERGEVTQIGLRSTRLLTRDDIEITLPNAVIGNAKIVNESGGPGPKSRVRVKVGVAYGEDLEQVRDLLLEISGSESRVAEAPAPRVRMRGFGDSSVDFELLCWIDEPVLRGQTLDALYFEVYRRFGEEGIEIPFPQRVVHLAGGGAEPADG